MWLEEKYMSFAKRIYKYSKQSEGFKRGRNLNSVPKQLSLYYG